MPGYLPEMEPAAFDSFENARAFILEEMDREADNLAALAENAFAEESDANFDRNEAEELGQAAADLRAEGGDVEWGDTVGNCAYWITFDAEATACDEL